jgi:hypothetical protein
MKGTAQRQHHPPSWAQRFVEWYCKPRLAEDLTGDLNENFERNVRSIGPGRAKLIYMIDPSSSSEVIPDVDQNLSTFLSTGS